MTNDGDPKESGGPPSWHGLEAQSLHKFPLKGSSARSIAQPGTQASNRVVGLPAARVQGPKNPLFGSSTGVISTNIL